MYLIGIDGIVSNNRKKIMDVKRFEHSGMCYFKPKYELLVISTEQAEVPQVQHFPVLS